MFLDPTITLIIVMLGPFGKMEPKEVPATFQSIGECVATAEKFIKESQEMNPRPIAYSCGYERILNFEHDKKVNI